MDHTLPVLAILAVVVSVVSYGMLSAETGRMHLLCLGTPGHRGDHRFSAWLCEQLQAQETVMEGLNPVCLSTVLTHGHKMERAIVLMS